ncbi:SixA phosphatase family protein [Mesorhizobium sp. ANAO-SY3R2]|uniref:SixA phosphatase family protein n=1 Tax=Mesorhizobium sp. ANAO-SY3R2 TaxID=3166644 RepID=UPI003671790F
MARTRQLLLLRHAKSSWDDGSLSDFDRPLAPRGEKAAPRIGAEMARRNWLPDLALVSPAARTRETWRLVSADWPEPAPPVLFHEDLYEASADELLAESRLAPDRVATLLIVGHNPGLEEFARRLAGPGSDAKASALLGEKLPTGAFARFAVEGRWDKLQFGVARLTHCLRPKDLG